MENDKYKWGEVARHYFTKDFPMLYRNHAWPESDPDRISKANDWMGMTLLNRGDFTLTPVLRRVSSITEEEARVIYAMLYGKEYEPFYAAHTCLDWFDAGAPGPAKGMDRPPALLDPRVWHYLTTLRIDFFDLIENGEAVDEDTVKVLPGW